MKKRGKSVVDDSTKAEFRKIAKIKTAHLNRVVELSEAIEMMEEWEEQEEELNLFKWFFAWNESTMVLHSSGEVVGKASSMEEAIKMLKQLKTGTTQ